MSFPFLEGSFPAISGKVVTPSDATVISARSLYIGVGGTVVVEWTDGTTSTFINVVSGTILPVNVVKVRASTTATNIIALL